MGKTETLEYTQNRELSWLRFNQRVLEEAQDESVPLMERMKFVAIFTSNLDEFFMIRVGSLYDMAVADSKKQDIRSGMTPKQQLEEIYKAVAPLYKERDKTYAEIKKQLQPYGVCGLDFKELEQQEKKYVKKYFKEQVLPVLSPQIVDANHPFPHLLNKDIYVVATLKMENNVIYYMGPSPAREGRPIGSAGPTTATRMDRYAPTLLDLGEKAMIGKGKRSKEVIDAIVRNHAVYFAAVGGAGALLSKCITKSEIVCYEDLGAEAIRKLQVKDFPVIVVIDSEGNNLYETAIKKYCTLE